MSDAAGVNHVVVHAVEPRDSVYENPEFHNRLDEFHDSLWSYPLQGFIHPLGGAGYVDVTQLVDDLKDEPGPEDAFAIGPLLGPEQRAALRCMVPFPEIFGRSDASVVLAHGPPGSGKTVLAIEAAKEAFETFGHSVIVLVPNERLRAAYQSALTEEGITFGDWKTFLTQQEQLICVAELPEIIEHFSGSRPGTRDRSQALERWWDACLEQTALVPWARDNPEVRESRFLQLLDAVLEDSEDEDLKAHQKDSLDRFDGRRYTLIAELQASDRWVALTTDELHRRHLRLRCDLAREAMDALSRVRGPRGSLLIVVDEAQDLAPAEWRGLIDWCASRHSRERETGEGRSELATRLVLLGDENQRISPTSFSWNEVKRYAHEQFGEDARATVSTALTGTFRLGRPIARVANGLFDSRVTDRSGARHVAVVNPESLESEDGEVIVVLVADPVLATGQTIATLPRQESEHTRLRILTPDIGKLDQQFLESANVDAFIPRFAKGLEFDSVVVVAPFPGGRERLDYSDVTETYTCLTRAQKRVLVVLSESAWRLIGPVWAPLVTLKRANADISAVEILQEQFTLFTEQVGVEAQRHVLIAGLRQRLEGLSALRQEPSDHSPEIRAAARQMWRLLSHEGDEAIPADFIGWLGGSHRLTNVVSDILASNHGDDSTHEAAALLTLLGATAGAADLLRGEGFSEVRVSALATAGGHRERLAYLVRRERVVDRSVSGEALAGLVLAEEARKLAGAIDIQAQILVQ